MASETQEASNEVMRWSDLHGDMQLRKRASELRLKLNNLSADLFLGVPYNIASYALLTHMIADLCDLEVGDYVHTFGDVHLYNSHIESGVVEEQLRREPKPLPTIAFDPVYSIHDYRVDSFQLVDYHSHPALKAEIAV